MDVDVRWVCVGVWLGSLMNRFVVKWRCWDEVELETVMRSR